MPVKYSKDNLTKAIEDAEKKKDSKEAKEELKKLKSKKKKGKSLDESEDKINYEDIKYSENVFKTLKNTGFIDTVNV
jgi:FKBP-type peptidyl-prolyl cis-trans isomerase